MNVRGIANRYGRALFQVAADDGLFEEYYDQLCAFASLLKENPALKQFLLNPVFSDAERHTVAISILERLHIGSKVENFILLLISKRRIGIISEIAETYLDFVDQARGRIRVKVKLAKSIPYDLMTELKMTLETVTEKRVEIIAEEDPSLLGGIIVRVGDTIYDGSLKTQLKLISQRLLKP